MKVSKKCRKNVAKMSVVLREGNRVLKSLASLAVPKCTRDVFVKELMACECEDDTRVVRGVKVSPEDYESIAAVKALDGDLYVAFQRLIWQLAGKTKRRLNTDMPVEEIFQEGCLAFVKKMYYYTADDTKFFTFIYLCLRREMFRAVNKNNKFSPICNHGLALYKRYETLMREMNGRGTFDENVEKLGLNEQERKLLMSVLVQMHSGRNYHKEDDGESYDYTDVEAERRWKDSRFTLEPDDIAWIRSLPWTKEEQVVLEAWIKDGENGWMTRLSDGLGITRAAISKTKRAIEEYLRDLYVRRHEEKDVTEKPVVENKPRETVKVRSESNDALRGIVFGIDTYHQKLAVRFGYDKRTFSMTAGRAKHVLAALREHGAEAVVKAIKTVIALTDGVLKKATDQDGISYGTDKYHGKPVVRFGYGNSTCSLIAVKARHILRAIEENGGEKVAEALETLMSLSVEKRKAA